ncbi:MAG: hypothetical protein PHP57_01595 [Sideroxydans sp.]|nr:hypothetical protein [Sideroxydans sp.]
MTTRFLRLFTLLSFALLQSIAPLVHAHVDGQNTHPTALAMSPALPFALIEHQHSVIEQDESQAIGLPHELQRDETPIITGSSTQLAPPAAQSVLSLFFFKHLQSQAISVAFITPHTLAPPRSA